MPRVNKRVGIRSVNTPLRFVAHVVEGERNENPGRIRTIRFDRSGGDQVWLNTEWKNGTDGATKTVLSAFDVNSDMKDKGAFLLSDEYERIGRPDLYADYMEYENKKISGQAFPTSLIPPRVLELQKLESARSKGTWKPPEKTLEGPAPEGGEAVVAEVPDDDSDDDMPEIGGGYKPKVRKAKK